MALGRQNARTCWCVVLGLSSKAGRSVDCKVNTVQRCSAHGTMHHSQLPSPRNAVVPCANKAREEETWI